MTTDRRVHWESVYSRTRAEETSWHQSVPRVSLDLIAACGPARSDALIDVGGGASRLVDHLLKSGYSDVSVLDLSAQALEQAKVRLGEDAARVHWIEADVTTWCAERRYRVWHDRAAFHFLTSAEDRKRYVAVLERALEAGGHLVLAAFAPDGPPRCSGLDVVRYDAVGLAAELGPGFHLEDQRRETHLTPLGREQQFGYYRFHRLH